MNLNYSEGPCGSLSSQDSINLSGATVSRMVRIDLILRVCQAGPKENVKRKRRVELCNVDPSDQSI